MLRTLGFLVLASLPGAAPAQVSIRIHPVNDRVTLLLPNEGSGTTIAVRGPEGTFLVDTMDDTVTTHLVRTLADLGVRDVRFVVNTHWHHNHLGGNARFPEATILGTDEMRRRLSLPQPLRFLVQRTYPARDSADHPRQSFQDTTTIVFNGEPVRLRHVRGHTNTDVIVHFPISGVVALGDLWSARGWIPADLDTGGNMYGVLEALSAVLRDLPPETVVVAGHGPPGTMADLERYVVRLRLTIDIVREHQASGRSLADVLALTLPADLQEWLGPRGGRMLEAIYRSQGTRQVIPSDGWDLVGTWREATGPGPGPAVLLLHGAWRDRTAYADLAEALAARGVASLRLDLRGHGESINLGRFVPGQNVEILRDDAGADVEAALKALRSRPGIDPRRIGVVGASYSGELAAVSGRRHGFAKAYVMLSPGSFSDTSFAGLDATGANWLFVRGSHERFVGEWVDEKLRAHSRTASLVILPGSGHGTDLLRVEPGLVEWVASWLALRL